MCRCYWRSIPERFVRYPSDTTVFCARGQHLKELSWFSARSKISLPEGGELGGSPTPVPQHSASVQTSSPPPPAPPQSLSRFAVRSASKAVVQTKGSPDLSTLPVAHVAARNFTTRGWGRHTAFESKFRRNAGVASGVHNACNRLRPVVPEGALEERGTSGLLKKNLETNICTSCGRMSGIMCTERRTRWGNSLVLTCAAIDDAAGLSGARGSTVSELS